VSYSPVTVSCGLCYVSGEICSSISVVLEPELAYISIHLDMPRIQALHLNINAHTVRWALLHPTQLNATLKSAELRQLKERHVIVTNSSADGLRILPPEPKDTRRSAIGGIPGHQKIYFVLQSLKAVLPNVVVKGNVWIM
jgi:hypothetical protein